MRLLAMLACNNFCNYPFWKWFKCVCMCECTCACSKHFFGDIFVSFFTFSLHFFRYTYDHQPNEYMPKLLLTTMERTHTHTHVKM